MAVAQRAMTTREWSLLALLSLLWGGSFFFIGVAVKELPPLTLAALRVGLAALILWASAPLTGARPPRTGKAFAALALLGLGNNALPFALIAWGQTHLPAGLASILNAATPLFAVLLAHAFTDEEKLSRFKIIGAVAGMAGVARVIGPDALLGRGGVDAWAEGAVLLAGLSYAATAMFARRAGGLGLKPLDVATGQTTAGAIYLVPIAPLRPAVVAPGSERGGYRLRVRDRRGLHGPRLCRLLPHPFWCGSDERPARDPCGARNFGDPRRTHSA
jgi:drug/metabolite transporter (DMT)-like permease